MSEQIKQEGDFKLKKTKIPTVKKHNVEQITKVDFSNKEEATTVVVPEVTSEVTTVVIDKEITPIVEIEQPEVVVIETIDETPTEIIAEAKAIEQKAEEAIKDLATTGKPLPENVEKLISFMEETNGTVEDYARLNRDYSKVDPESLLKEFYKKTKPHLDQDEIDFYMDETFAYDEEEDEEREIKKKKIAFKEEVGKAKVFLEDLKNKYYDEIKLKPSVNADQQKALDFFNRYNEDQQSVEQMHSAFKDNTKKFFTQDFKGFDFNAGGKTFRFNLQNTDAIADKQSNITNLLKKFLNDKGEVTDMTGYHKAMYAAENTDSIANHFYEQGKADAIKDMLAKSNNISTEPRKTSGGEISVNGFKVKAINGVDSSKLKIGRKF